jgi:hypothetical protein
MANTGDVALAEKIAAGASMMVREYIAEMRKQGKIKGHLSILIKDGKTQIRLPYRD